VGEQAAVSIDGNYADAKNNAAAARSVLKVGCALLCCPRALRA